MISQSCYRVRWHGRKQRLEPCAGKLACTVLRGEGGGNTTLLPAYISTVDADGVALAAIQGLYQVVQAQEARLAALEQRNSSLEAQQRELAELRQAVEALKSARAGQTAGSPTMPWEGGFLGSLPLAGGLVLAGLALRSGAMPGSRRRR